MEHKNPIREPPELLPRRLEAPGREVVLVRRATPFDAEGVARMRQVLRAEEAGSVRAPEEAVPSIRDEIARIAGQARDPGLLTLVAESVGQLVGWLELTGGDSSRTAHRGWVTLVVEAGHRRRGIGRALLEGLHDWASRHPVLEQVALRCAATNEPALALYRALGYLEEGRFRRALKLAPGCYVDLVQLCREVTPGPSRHLPPL